MWKALPCKLSMPCFFLYFPPFLRKEANEVTLEKSYQQNKSLDKLNPFIRKPQILYNRTIILQSHTHYHLNSQRTQTIKFTVAKIGGVGNSKICSSDEYILINIWWGFGWTKTSPGYNSKQPQPIKPEVRNTRSYNWFHIIVMDLGFRVGKALIQSRFETGFFPKRADFGLNGLMQHPLNSHVYWFRWEALN